MRMWAIVLVFNALPWFGEWKIHVYIMEVKIWVYVKGQPAPGLEKNVGRIFKAGGTGNNWSVWEASWTETSMKVFNVINIKSSLLRWHRCFVNLAHDNHSTPKSFLANPRLSFRFNPGTLSFRAPFLISHHSNVSSSFSPISSLQWNSPLWSVHNSYMILISF